MIKTTELMLGNLLYLTLPENNGEERKVVVKVDAILPEDIRFELTCHRRSASPEELSEIPLTREIMDKIGEKKLDAPDEDCCWYKIHQFRHLLSFYDEHWEVVEVVMGCEIGFCYVDSVHQLQNLLTANGLPEAAKEVGEKVMELLTANQKQPCRH